jgi:hypothetical protein
VLIYRQQQIRYMINIIIVLQYNYKYIMDDKEENDILDLNLEYLLNKDQYNKYLNNKNPNTSKRVRKDKKFYKKRVFELTKQLLNNETPDRLTSDVVSRFDNYYKAGIEYFKILDKTDIIQYDYIDISSSYSLENTDLNTNYIIRDLSNGIGINNECDILLTTRSFDLPKKATLDNFVKVTNIKIKKEIIPLKKKINLKDPMLKIKGIGLSIQKKINNIDNKYEEKSKEEQV